MSLTVQTVKPTVSDWVEVKYFNHRSQMMKRGIKSLQVLQVKCETLRAVGGVLCGAPSCAATGWRA